MQTRSSSTNRRVTRQSTATQSAGAKRQALVQLEDPKPKRRRTTLATLSSSCAKEQSSIPTTSISAAPHRTTLRQERDESTRLRKELKQRDAEIERLTICATDNKKEVEVSARRQALDFLEEHYTCALCLDVMAHPLTLPHPHCGHSFCGICILKHFFSQYHRACGSWHENVSCPMCRGILTYTPSFTPSTSSRSLLSFPFAKNRAANSAICSLVQKLAGEKPLQKKGRGKGKSKAIEDTDEALALWRHGGTARTDWLDRDQRGKIEYLCGAWATLTSRDFTALKDRLLV
jgi:hypothetical protein